MASFVRVTNPDERRPAARLRLLASGVLQRDPRMTSCCCFLDVDRCAVPARPTTGNTPRVPFFSLLNTCIAVDARQFPSKITKANSGILSAILSALIGSGGCLRTL